jgi:hypothetical protein
LGIWKASAGTEAWFMIIRPAHRGVGEDSRENRTKEAVFKKYIQ